jgi:hypothetical protein
MPYKNGTPAFRRSEYQVANQIRLHCKTKCRAVGGVKRTAADGTNRGTLPYDVLTTNGLRIEVKDAIRNKRGEWTFNFARHGKLDESEVDFYVLCLRGLSKHYRVFVVIPAPMKVNSKHISLRQLISQWARYISNWQQITDAEEKAA